MTGRLIFPFLVGFTRRDVTGTRADPDSGGPLVSGFDDDFREPVARTVAGQRTSGVKELAEVKVPCQIESPTLEAMQLLSSGHSPTSAIIVVAHFPKLKALGLIDPGTGHSLIQPGDRVSNVYDRYGRLVQVINTPPGLYVTQAKAASYGLGSNNPNLVIFYLEARDQGSKQGG